MVIATYRPADVMLSGHPLNSVEQDLLVHRLCHRLDVDPLQEHDITRYLAGEHLEADVPHGLADLLHDTIGPGDSAGRIGGEEFALLFAGVTLLQAQMACDRLSRQLAATPLAMGIDGPIFVTMSVGLVPLDGKSLRERRKLLWNGAAAATLVVDKRGRAVAPPKVSLRGIEDEDGSLGMAITAGLNEMLADLSASERSDDGRIEEAARLAVRRVVRAHLGKKPLTDVHIVRI